MLELRLTFGNKKLPTSTAIFNMTTAHDCPSLKLGLCQMPRPTSKCYAMGPEWFSKDVCAHRNRQMEYWSSVTAREFVRDFLAQVTRRNGTLKVDKLRFNEAGDFRGQADVRKTENIARILKAYGVTTYLFTARKDLDFSKIEHLIVNGSNFRPYRGGNIFRAVPEASGKHPVCPGSCKTCTRCSRNHGGIVEVVYH